MIYLDADRVQLIHDELLEREDGLRGNNPSISLESVLHRIHSYQIYEEGKSVLEVAALYALSIAVGHPFLDGNKRTAFISMNIFLALNNYLLITNDYKTDAEDMLVKVANKEVDEKDLVVWLEKNTKLLNDENSILLHVTGKAFQTLKNMLSLLMHAVSKK